MLEKTLEARVTDLESIYGDVPEIMNLRFDSIGGRIDETNSRLNIIDRQMAALTRDVRDTRGGVTRLLVEFDKRIGGVEQRLDRVEQRLEKLDQRFEKADLRLEDFGTQLTEILRRLPR